MFDTYRPAGELRCPWDDHPLVEWQGTDGPRALVVWHEGERHPTDDWLEEEMRRSPAELKKFTLPASFTIYSSDCPVHHPIRARCTTQDGVWSSTAVCPLSEQPTLFWLAMPREATSSVGVRETRRVREFILVDLTTQMPYLPRYAQSWPRERILAWLRVWGEVRPIDIPGWDSDSYTFRSWVGLWTTFRLTDDGRMLVPGTQIRAWPEGGPPDR